MSSNHQCPLDKLQQKQDDVPYHCNACKEVGFGSRYWCNQCNNYALHPCCKERKPPKERKVYENRKPELVEAPTSTPTQNFCIACGRNIRGIYYKWDGEKSGRKNIYTHPNCATLPDQKSLHVDFNCPYGSKSLPKDSYNSRLRAEAGVQGDCCRCRHLHHRTRPVSWSYQLAEHHFLHVACIEEMEIEKWERNKFGTGNALARAQSSRSQK